MRLSSKQFIQFDEMLMKRRKEFIIKLKGMIRKHDYFLIDIVHEEISKMLCGDVLTHRI